MMKPPSLSHKQRLFVENYIQTAGNGTAAARQAGYSGNAATLAVVAHENLKKPNLQAELARRRNEIQDRLEISTQAKRQRLWTIAHEAACLTEVSRRVEVQVAEDGTIVKTIYVEIMPFDPAAAIKAIHELNLMDGDYVREKVALPDF